MVLRVVRCFSDSGIWQSTPGLSGQLDQARADSVALRGEYVLNFGRHEA